MGNCCNSKDKNENSHVSSLNKMNPASKEEEISESPKNIEYSAECKKEKHGSNKENSKDKANIEKNQRHRRKKRKKNNREAKKQVSETIEISINLTGFQKPITLTLKVSTYKIFCPISTYFSQFSVIVNRFCLDEYQ
jgi:hypothetical protein